MNAERLAALIAKIEANPGCWDQAHWHCGTAACLAGLAQLASGKKANSFWACRDGCDYLDLTLAQGRYLFNARRTLADFKEFLTLKPGEYGAAGYDVDGLDRAGRAVPLD